MKKFVVPSYALAMLGSFAVLATACAPVVLNMKTKKKTVDEKPLPIEPGQSVGDFESALGQMRTFKKDVFISYLIKSHAEGGKIALRKGVRDLRDFVLNAEGIGPDGELQMKELEQAAIKQSMILPFLNFSGGELAKINDKITFDATAKMAFFDYGILAEAEPKVTKKDGQEKQQSSIKLKVVHEVDEDIALKAADKDYPVEMRLTRTFRDSKLEQAELSFIIGAKVMDPQARDELKYVTIRSTFDPLTPEAKAKKIEWLTSP